MSILLLLLSTAASAQGPAKVTTTRVSEHTFHPVTQVLGEAESVRAVVLSAEVEGLVDDLLVVEGQNVAAGVALLEQRKKRREILKRGAEAELEIAEEQLREYEKGSRPEEIVAAEKAVADARALVAEADEELTRQQGLRESGVGSERDLTIARARAESRRAILARQEAELALVKQGPRDEVLARARAQVALRRTALDLIADEISKSQITAPFAGVIARKNAEKGSYLRPGDPVLTLVQMHPMRVHVTVPEWLVGRIERGVVLDVTFDALAGEAFKGKVDAIIPTADRATRTFPVKLLLDNPEHRILPGMVARARVPTAQGTTSLAVPRDAVVPSPMGTIVYRVEDGAATPVRVTTGVSEGVLVAVEGALAAGDTIVLRGNETLRPGQKVVVVGSDAPASEKRD